MDNETIKTFVGSAVRWLLVLLAGILVKKGIISTEESDVYVNQALPVVIGLVIALGTLAWSIWQKRSAAAKQDSLIETAVKQPASTSVAEVKAIQEAKES